MDTTLKPTRPAAHSNPERAVSGDPTHWFAVFGAVFGAGLIAEAITLAAPLPVGDGGDARLSPATTQRSPI
jgi:hypothetical protein